MFAVHLRLDNGELQTRLEDPGLAPQFLSFGSGAVLDQRFADLAGVCEAKTGSVGIVGGATRRDMLRSASNCLWGPYMSSATAWKGVSNAMGENLVVGLTARLKVFRPY